MVDGENGSESMTEETNNVTTGQEQQQQGVGGQIAEQAGQQVAQQGKKAVKKVAEKAGKEVAKGAAKSSLLASLSTVLMYVALVLVIIFVIIGLIMFFVTMPGMIMDKLKALFKAMGNYVAAFFGADTTEQIDAVQIYETLDYLEQMGWDIKSEGFLTGYVEEGDLTSDQISQIEEDEDRDWEYDEETGVVRYDDGKVAYAESDFIFTYIMSDNYVYTLKNKNVATQNPDGNWFEKLVRGVATAWYKIRNFMFSPLMDALGITDAVVGKWGKGLIGIYYDTGEVGRSDGLANTGTLWNWDSISINPETKKLAIKRRSIFNNNNAIEFSLDGWTGRYGMPVEFLLSVHKATMMPDLAMDMVTAFPTEISLLLHETGGTADAGYKVGGKMITYPDFEEAVLGYETDNWLKKFFSYFQRWLDSKAHMVQAAHNAGVDVFGDYEGCECKPKEGSGCVCHGYQVKDGKFADTYYEDDGKTICTDPDGKTPHKKGEKCPKDKTKDIYIVDEPCARCKGIVTAIFDKLGSNQDYNFKAYSPYISHVSDHWYRNVYFVINKNSGDENYIGDLEPDRYKGGSIGFVDNDYDYESQVHDRWTLYETYTNDPADEGTYKYNPEKAGEFIIFEIDENGEYKKSGGEYVIFEGDFVDARPTILFTKNGDKYVEYTGSRVDIQGDVYRYTSDGEYVKYTGDVAVSKKAVTFESDDEDRMEDLGWIKNSSNVWSAYKAGDTSTEFETLFTPEEIAAEEGEWTKYVMQRSFIKMSLTGNIVQVGEGQRTETNPKIKKMFLNNNYFRYTGDETTAEIITELRDEVASKRGSSKSKYGPIADEELDYYIQKTVDGKNEKYYVKDFVGKVMLNQDSLNAFSMLENTHTLDADYIYRDFKELIVELGYFTKEEVTGMAAKRVMQFPIPDIGSYLYPRRSIDKIENEYGTMAHSRLDIVANEKNTMKALIASLGTDVTEENRKDIEQQNMNAGINVDASQNMQADMLNSNVNVDAAQSMQADMLSANSGIDISEVGSIEGAKSVKSVSLKKFLQTSREMCEYIDSVGYDYCVYCNPGKNDYRANCTCTDECIADYEAHKRPEGDGIWSCFKATNGSCSCGSNHCKHLIHGNPCGLQKTFEASKASGKQNLCCATLISWALQNVKVMPDSAHEDGAESLANWIKKNLDPEIIEKGQPLKEGDILCYKGHIDMVGDSLDIKFNGGHQVEKGAQEGTGKSSINKLNGWGDANFALRLDWGGSSEPAKYEGYNGNEAVVSPVTGVLLEYGTYDKEIDSTTGEEYRVNVDILYGKDKNVDIEELKKVEDADNTETKKEEKGATVIDKVGYAKILVLDAEHYQKLEANSANQWKNDSLVKVVETKVVEKNGENEIDTSTKETVIYRDLEDFNVDTYKEWTVLDKTVYGYKEFAELYNSTGIAGNVVYIDGFVTEKPDEKLPVSYEEYDEMDIEVEKELPDGEDLKKDSFKVMSSTLNTKKESDKAPMTRYEPDEVYKLPSKKAMEKAEADQDIKAQSSTAITVTAKNDEGVNETLYFIKEGTVIGRTMTDKELIEKVRVNPPENFDAYRPKPEVDAEGKEIDNSRVMGNYLRVIMRDLDGTVVENVEDYMKLDQVVKRENDWELFYWLPFESGGTDEPGCGPESQGTCSEGETAVGIIQWTVLLKSNMNNIAGQFIPECLKMDPQLCAPLAAYASWTGQQFWDDYNGDKQFQATLKEICKTNRDEFLYVQMEVAKKQYLEPILKKYPWLEQRPSCVQGEIMHLKVWGAKWDWIKDYENKTNEEIIAKVRHTIANTGSTAGAATGDETTGRAYNEPEIAYEILSGKVNEDDVEQWVRTRDTSVFTFKFRY